MVEDPPKLVTNTGGLPGLPVTPQLSPDIATEPALLVPETHLVTPLPETVAEAAPVPKDEIEPGHPGIVELFEDSAGEWRFRVKGGNHEIVATSEGYVDKHGARRGYETLFNIMRHSKTEHREAPENTDVV